jgi:phenylalanyl-tRNA synthetase beta chain
MQFIETITHTLVSDRAGEAFLARDATLLRVDDARAGGEPALRPSVITSLLRVRRHNEDQGATNLRLFENASAFHYADGKHVERPTLALLADAPTGVGARDAQDAFRLMRGIVERILALVAPRTSRVEFVKTDDVKWMSVAARVMVDGHAIGVLGLVDARVLKAHGIDRTSAAAELELRGLLAQFPPDNASVELPAFPAADRDISAIVAEGLAYGEITSAIDSLQLPFLESINFVTTFRGKQIGDNRKSVSLRLVFRKTDGTLTSEEADASVSRAIAYLRTTLNAEIRG